MLTDYAKYCFTEQSLVDLPSLITLESKGGAFINPYKVIMESSLRDALVM